MPELLLGGAANDKIKPFTQIIVVAYQVVFFVVDWQKRSLDVVNVHLVIALDRKVLLVPQGDVVRCKDFGPLHEMSIIGVDVDRSIGWVGMKYVAVNIDLRMVFGTYNDF